MKLFLSSITHHNCPVELREMVSFDRRQRRLLFNRIHTQQGISEAVILQTCNRTEVYLYAKKSFDCNAFLVELIRQTSPDAADTWAKYSRTSTGNDAVAHLFEVAAGLDSQMLGENQILAQVKAAYTESIDRKMSRFVFHRLFHTAFRVGKAVRSETDIGCGAVSISLAAVQLAKEKIDISSSTALVIGAGENAELTARYLLKMGLPHLIIANRDKQKARAMRTRLKSGDIIGLDEIPSALAEIDLLISSTASDEPIVKYENVAEFLKESDRQLLIIDIAVPRDIDPQISQFESVSLYNIDDLNEQIAQNKQLRSRQIPKAQALIAEAVDKFAHWYDSLDIVPVISQLTKKGTELARIEAKRYAKNFSESDRKKLECFAKSLVKKVLHGPISFLKSGGDDEQLTAEQIKAVELINKMFLSETPDDK